MGINIISTGSYTPSQSITNDDIAKLVETNDEWIRTRKGISSRHISGWEPTWYMGAETCKKAIEKSGINPEDIGIEKLVSRIQKSSFNEIIIAVKPTIEGETTSLYIKKILEGLNIKVTRIASGVPLGADIEYIDSMTLERALIDRKEIE